MSEFDEEEPLFVQQFTIHSYLTVGHVAPPVMLPALPSAGIGQFTGDTEMQESAPSHTKLVSSGILHEPPCIDELFLRAPIDCTLPGSELFPFHPVDQKEKAEQKQGTGDCQVGTPVKFIPGPDYVEYRQRGEQDRPDPFPAPCENQCHDDDVCRNEVDQQGEYRFPEAVIFAEHVNSEETDEYREENAQNPGSPEEDSSGVRIHIGTSCVVPAYRWEECVGDYNLLSGA